LCLVTKGSVELMNVKKSDVGTDYCTLGANSGHIRVALRLLRSLSWISQNPQGEYQLTPKS
ncbi:hypothetical protein, partial [Nostoc sp. 'Peltigera malacea cyanobiont' DB3992]|uniref:hypothetical protein n=1 Tax=Nostoc sp. 'Peltigera malacea cyanobiont' DB3992 TaxID=1206980 RepID=UPI000C06430A